MIYKNFQNLKLSALGMGAMRLPIIGSEWDASIDEAATDKMVAYAVKHGVNYFDTAWGYHDGQSEAVIGRLLGKYPRESWFLADKFPGYDLSNMDKVETVFEEQLTRCGVEYFDFYLFHNVCEMNIDAYLDERYGVREYLVKQKEAGRIRHLGFSSHGSYDVMKRFLEAYGRDMEFCQIQLNYVDWTFQDAKGKLSLLNDYGIPVWVMEPMRGGRLASLSEDDSKKLKELRPNESIPTWALRFVLSIPEVAVTLTGASNLVQLEENINVYQEVKPLSGQEIDLLMRIAEGMIQQTVLPCTSCNYCTGHCPKHLNIPDLISLYNEHCFTVSTGGLGFIAPMALSAMPEERQPKSCIACRKCEAVCPQRIKIADVMADFVTKLNPTLSPSGYDNVSASRSCPDIQ